MIATAVILSALAATSLAIHVATNSAIDLRPSVGSKEEFMQAVAYDANGDLDVLKLRNDYPKPIPNDNQVLVQVKASALNPVDFKLRRNPVPSFFIPRPKIVGFDVAGVVVQVGKGVKTFQVGDKVAGMMPLLGSKWGAAAEYSAIDESFLGRIEDNEDSVGFQSAALLPLAALTALQTLNKIENPKGKKVLIQAGAGGVGTIAIQYAKVLGMFVATTASEAKADFLRGLGADLVIDYRREKFEDVIEGYDAVLDSMSFLYESRTLGPGSRVLAPHGHYLHILSSDWSFKDGKEDTNILPSFANWCKHATGRVFGANLPKYDFTYVRPNGNDMQEILDMVADGKIRPIVDKIYPLGEIKKAMEYLETGRATGKVVLNHE